MLNYIINGTSGKLRKSRQLCQYSDQAKGQTTEVSGFDSRQGQLLFSIVSMSVLGLTHYRIQRVQEDFPRGQNGWGMKLTTHFQPVPRFRMRGGIPPFNISSWCVVRLSEGTLSSALLKYLQLFLLTYIFNYSVS